MKQEERRASSVFCISKVSQMDKAGSLGSSGWKRLEGGVLRSRPGGKRG